MLESDGGSSSEEESEEESESEADDASDDEKAMATAEQEGLETPSGLEYVAKKGGGRIFVSPMLKKRALVCSSMRRKKDFILTLAFSPYSSAAPSGVTSLGVGMETPESIDLRKRRTIEASMEQR